MTNLYIRFLEEQPHVDSDIGTQFHIIVPYAYANQQLSPPIEL